MAVVEADDELLEKPARLVLPQPVLLDNKLEHVAAGRKLHRYAQVRGRQEHLRTAHRQCGRWVANVRTAAPSASPVVVLPPPGLASGRPTHLPELHDVRVDEAPVVDDLALHVLGDLRATWMLPV